MAETLRQLKQAKTKLTAAFSLFGSVEAFSIYLVLLLVSGSAFVIQLQAYG